MSIATVSNPQALHFMCVKIIFRFDQCVSLPNHFRHFHQIIHVVHGSSQLKDSVLTERCVTNINLFLVSTLLLEAFQSVGQPFDVDQFTRYFLHPEIKSPSIKQRRNVMDSPFSDFATFNIRAVQFFQTIFHPIQLTLNGQFQLSFSCQLESFHQVFKSFHFKVH